MRYLFTLGAVALTVSFLNGLATWIIHGTPTPNSCVPYSNWENLLSFTTLGLGMAGCIYAATVKKGTRGCSND